MNRLHLHFMNTRNYDYIILRYTTNEVAMQVRRKRDCKFCSVGANATGYVLFYERNQRATTNTPLPDDSEPTGGATRSLSFSDFFPNQNLPLPVPAGADGTRGTLCCCPQTKRGQCLCNASIETRSGLPSMRILKCDFQLLQGNGRAMW